jgi:RimJ/RimL family protein N-acetyltransferase
MKMEPKNFTLKDGRTLVLRSVSVDDAEVLIEHLKIIGGETSFLSFYPEEITSTVEQEGAFLQKTLDSPKSLMIVAEVDGEVAGNCSFDPAGRHMRLSHRCDIGIALKEKYCSLGIGTILLTTLLEEAKNAGYEQAELLVFARNHRAQGLYKKLGFVPCGVTMNAAKYKDGTYDDEISMVKKL